MHTFAATYMQFLTPIWDILGISLGGICGQKIQIGLMTSHMFEKILGYIILKLQEFLYIYVTRTYHVTSSSGNYCAIKKNFPENLGIEWASFVDKKSTRVWECQGAPFVDKKSTANIYIEF